MWAACHSEVLGDWLRAPGVPLSLELSATRVPQEVLQQLARARATPDKGVGAARLVASMRVDALQLVPVLDTLVALDWIAPLAEDGDGGDPRYVLLADPSTPIEPLLEALLMPKAEPLEDLWQKGPLRSLRLGDVLLI